MEVVRLPPEIKPLLPRTLTFVPARLTAPAQALTPLKSSPLLVVSPAVSKVSGILCLLRLYGESGWR
jgi:hypothetical protein